MSFDQEIIVVAISAYVVGALALLNYLLTRSEIAKRIGIPFAILGCAAQFYELAYRGTTTNIWPLTNLYGSLTLFAAMSVLIFIGFALRFDLWFMGGFVLALAAGFSAYSLTWDVGYLPAVPALQSYWIKIHVPLVISAYASFLVASVSSTLYLIKYYGEQALAAEAVPVLKTATAGGPALGPTAMPRAIIVGDAPNLERAAAGGNTLALWLATLPTLPKLDIITYRVVALGLPLLSIGIITGAWWAKEAWGAYWQWDAKETAALVSWVIYLLYLHLHTRNSWRGLRCAWISVVGFLSIVFCYLGVNILISGLHSYKV
jgi:cytochrome c-type biogenesis protein CcsB